VVLTGMKVVCIILYDMVIIHLCNGVCEGGEIASMNEL